MICYENNHRDGAVNVKSMLASLFQLGLSQAEIAALCGSTQPTISRAANGAMVRYELGKAIEDIYLKETKALGAAQSLAQSSLGGLSGDYGSTHSTSD